jgi:hypothetical protein
MDEIGLAANAIGDDARKTIDEGFIDDHAPSFAFTAGQDENVGGIVVGGKSILILESDEARREFWFGQGLV